MRTLESHLGRQLRSPCWHPGKSRERVRAWLRELGRIAAELRRVHDLLGELDDEDLVLALAYEEDIRGLEHRRKLLLGNLLLKHREGHLTRVQLDELREHLRAYRAHIQTRASR